jgi:hypothetical protein
MISMSKQNVSEQLGTELENLSRQIYDLMTELKQEKALSQKWKAEAMMLRARILGVKK